MRWTIHGERVIYDNEWIRLALTDVELPSGTRLEHHVVRSTADAAGVVVHESARGVLLLWRHRFITDTWGWEIPAGRIDAGETPMEAGQRECVEESGWAPGPLTELASYFPNNGLSDCAFYLYLADGATELGPPTDPDEAERVEWLTVDRVREEIAAGQMGDGLTLTALTWCLAFGLI